MDAKERIISIRLLEKMKKNPEYKKVIDIEAKLKEKNLNKKAND